MTASESTSEIGHVQSKQAELAMATKAKNPLFDGVQGTLENCAAALTYLQHAETLTVNDVDLPDRGYFGLHQLYGCIIGALDALAAQDMVERAQRRSGCLSAREREAQPRAA